jgi:hypothetical protein
MLSGKLLACDCQRSGGSEAERVGKNRETAYRRMKMILREDVDELWSGPDFFVLCRVPAVTFRLFSG